MERKESHKRGFKKWDRKKWTKKNEEIQRGQVNTAMKQRSNKGERKFDRAGHWYFFYAEVGLKKSVCFILWSCKCRQIANANMKLFCAALLQRSN